jgi:hypothetical protein
MIITTGFLILLAAAPLLLLLAGKKLARLTLAVFAVTALVTWIASTILLTRLIEGEEDVFALILAMLVFTPLLGVGVASTIARFALKAPALAAVVFACQGWYVGFFLFTFLGTPSVIATDGGLWDWGCAWFTAVPAMYAALGAAVAGNLKWRWQT